MMTQTIALTPTVSSIPAVNATPKSSRFKPRKLIVKAIKRVVPLALAIYFIPWVLLAYVIMGLLDVMRNSQRTLSTIDRYFAGNGVFTWFLSPFNLTMDLLCIPFRNKGIYKLTDLPAGHQAEIQKLIDAAHQRDVVGQLSQKLGNNKRGMIFFKWYGKNIDASIDIPEYHDAFKYIRTIGVSVFNKKASTGLHYGPLRVTLRVLYNINPVDDSNVYITVGSHTHRWREQQLFIFDDTLQHQSVNGADAPRYCLFVDMIRPTMMPGVLRVILTGIRLILAPFRAIFYKHWSIIK